VATNVRTGNSFVIGNADIIEPKQYGCIAALATLDYAETARDPGRTPYRPHLDTACFTCRQRIDPIGFVFENYDPVGRWRIAWPGTKLKNAIEFKVLLVENIDLFSQCVAEKLTPLDDEFADMIIASLSARRQPSAHAKYSPEAEKDSRHADSVDPQALRMRASVLENIR
jgi:hypothetical protein